MKGFRPDSMLKGMGLDPGELQEGFSHMMKIMEYLQSFIETYTGYNSEGEKTRIGDRELILERLDKIEKKLDISETDSSNNSEESFAETHDSYG